MDQNYSALIRIKNYEAMSTQHTICRYFFLLFFIISFQHLSAEGSKNVTPSATGTATAVNNFIGYLEHDVALAGEPYYFESGSFLQAGAPVDERVYLHIRAGESLYWGLRRIIAPGGEADGDYEDLHVILYDGSDAEVARWTIEGSGSAVFPVGSGVITDHAEAAAGPEQIVGAAAGYDANVYLNNTGSDQDFYVVFIQTDAALGANPTEADDIDLRSTYDIWDFSVFNGLEEKPGRLFSKKWGFTAYAPANLFSENFQLYVRIPSEVGGETTGNYVKQLDLGGIQPFSVNFYANDVGHIGSDFLVQRQSQNTENATLGYDIFINNPDLDVYPTTALPTITITDAIFDCSGSGGAGIINFVSNQVGQVAVILNLNGQSGYQENTTDVIVEGEITAIGSFAIRWDGLDGLGGVVASGTQIDISGRFTSAPLHVPMWDVEENDTGIRMVDIRPATSFDLIYWDDPLILGLESDPNTQLTGTNVNTHIWGGGTQEGNNISTNTWSFGYYQINSQVVNFTYVCDSDGDNVNNGMDEDGDNDGISDAQEGYTNLEYKDDVDGDGIPNYLDPEFVDFVDANSDGVNDNFDTDFDGIPDALDLDSDNDGIPDIVEVLLVDADNDGMVDVITDSNGNGIEDTYDPECDGSAIVGYGASVESQSGTFNAGNALGDSPGSEAQLFGPGSEIVLELSHLVPSGSNIAVNLRADVGQTVDVSVFGYTEYPTGGGSGTGEAVDENGLQIDLTVTQNTRFVEISYDAGGGELLLSHVNYTFSGCSALSLPDSDSDGIPNFQDLDSDNDGIADVFEAGGTSDANGRISGFIDDNGNGRNDTQDIGALSIPDTDADGTLPNYLDIDSDNDGILDNIEAQNSATIIALVAGDTDGNGLLDIYDPQTEGTLLVPINTDGDEDADYLDADSDNDGIADLIEGHDSDSDGFGDWDTDSNNDITDETNYTVDTNTDGLRDFFEETGGTPAPIQNTDNADRSDWQDTDDDNDGILTSGEDFNENGDWTDDLTQGGVTIPDYLFRGDYDNDGVADATDIDDDNDGILDTDETGDTDGDGVLNSLDLDSDNDGILDAIEANNGAIPSGFNQAGGQFVLNDPDEDGLMNAIDNTPGANGGMSTLPNPDTDSDGLNDKEDIDSDGDGITDFFESLASSSELVFSFLDNDGDGLDDSFDPDQGGSLLIPVNTDEADNPDYLDNDSDNDGVMDLVEGSDANSDGFGDWDADENGTTNELGTDTDGDGLDDAFDNTGLGNGNSSGSNAARQNTDGVDDVDYRDTDDDNDGNPTSVEDNGDEIWTNDFTEGQADMSVPDYLYFGDFDGDGQADLVDADSDNDGLLDVTENNGQTINAWEDEDDDGIPNFRDTDDTGVTTAINVTDANVDGVYDVFDSDLDGLPDFRDSDSDNDGIADLVEAGGIDSDGDGQVDDATDTDNDGLADTFDTDDGGTPLFASDKDADGLRDAIDIDSDNDGLPDITEAGGTDSNGDGRVDGFEDLDADGFANTMDTDNGGTNLVRIDSDGDLVLDLHDRDSDNDGITDVVEHGGIDSDGDGEVDGSGQDSDGDGLANTVDPDAGGSPLSLRDSDGDLIPNARDLDSDNDGYQDILEGEGIDTNGDGIVAAMEDDDLTSGVGIPNSVDVTNTGGTDTDGDGIDDLFDTDYLGGIDTEGVPDGIPDAVDVDQIGGGDDDDDGISNTADVDNTMGTDIDGDGIDDNFDPDRDGDGIENAFDPDANGDGYDDATQADPFYVPDFDSDGLRDFIDLDSDGDGLTDVVEFDQTPAASSGQIDAFADANLNGWNDAQEAAQITPPNTDGDAFPSPLPNYIDLDSDDDGIVDNYEAQSRAAYVPPLGADIDLDGLDDAYDPNVSGGVLLTPVNTDGADQDDYLDDDSDNDTVDDLVEGSNAGRGQYADWDSNANALFDDAGFDEDTDDDGILNIFDNYNGTGISQITGSNAAVQDTDQDGLSDFQDADDDDDLENTIDEDDQNVNDDPTDDFQESGPFPDYLFSPRDADLDGVLDDGSATRDIDSDNDGLSNIAEDGGIGIDPSADIEAVPDGLLNYEDDDWDGDGILNVNDSDADGDANPDTFGKSDSNNDGIIDAFDHDLDGVPDFLDRDSDNDGISDAEELSSATGLTDPNSDGQIDDDAAYDDTGTPNGMHDALEAGIVEPDTDLDGIPNHLDLDSDNDGITDNREAQTSADYRAPVNLDGDNDGILDVYDADEDGAITPENTDSPSDALPDYLDLDSDADGVLDQVEGFDPDADGFSDLDLDMDNSLTDEFGYTADTDLDGILNLFDTTNQGFSTISNIDGSSQVLQDVNTDSEPDFRDEDDDGDGTNSSAEDTNPNDGNWTNDFTQGGDSPDYLHSPDRDSDLVPDNMDADADNDGIPNTLEYSIATDPFGITGGVYNYSNPVGAGLTDSNNDGVADEYDTDLDGVPDFFDLDSDNDGIPDAVEANGGSLPSGNMNSNGQFGVIYAQNNDGDGDGLISDVDTNDGDGGVAISTLEPILNTDGTGPPDFQDLDSDNDGITDNVEAQAFPIATISGNDGDGDGLDDTFDSDNGGTAITILNTNSPADPDPDYLDPDSDNDGVLDRIEGHDANQNGFADWDNDNDNDPSDITDFDTDTDGDGIIAVFDSYSGTGLNNINGVVASIQDTDEDDIPDFRDADDDSDGIDTSDATAITGEDQDNDGDWSNDFTQGGGSTPNYLYAGSDRDGDGISDASDLDSDNDGIPDAVENTAGIDPFGDLDDDGTFNYLDQSDGNGLLDSDSDGVNDVFDFDLDGVPNFFDLDSDNDGITDHEESGGTDDGTDENQGVLDNFNDTAPADGQDDDTSLTALDFDLDGQPNFLDLDSDNDGVQDIIEAGGSDSSSPADGYGDTAGDSDGDGLLNQFESSPLSPWDQDGDGLDNHHDADSDNDGIPDIVEAGGSDDGDGRVDILTDDNSNGWSNSYDGNALPSPDTDNDGLLDAFDLDADGDGIPDVAEANAGAFPAAITDFDGRYTYAGNDLDGDGFVDNVDTNNGGNPLGITSTDGDGIPDFQDTDSDADGAPDYIEAFDDDEVESGLSGNDALEDYLSRATAYGVENSGDPSPYVNTSDTDADGIPNWLEGNPPNFLNPNNEDFYRDSDNDGLVDLFDTDDGGMQYGGVSGVPDNNGVGGPNQLDNSDVITLPVELLFFIGEEVDRGIQLSWKTASELNNSRFIIEKSIDALEFSSIGEVTGSGTTSEGHVYSYLDLNPANGINYYRLVQIDYDGSAELSETIAVIAKLEELVISVFPNPASDQFSIKLNRSVHDLRVRLNDISGSLIFEDRFSDVRTSEITMDSKGMQKGVYVLSIFLNGKIENFKLVIDR